MSRSPSLLFKKLEHFLVKWAPLWGERPFHHWPPTWISRYPRLAQALFDLNQSTSLTEYQADRGQKLEAQVNLEWIQSFEPELCELTLLHHEIASSFPVPSSPYSFPSSLDHYFHQYPHDFDGIKERKQDQIIELTRKGLKPHQIAKELDIGVASVYRYRIDESRLPI